MRPPVTGAGFFLPMAPKPIDQLRLQQRLAPPPPRISRATASAFIWSGPGFGFPRALLAGWLLLCTIAAGIAAEAPPTKGPTVPGETIVMKGDIACAPAKAPEAVKRAIWATNTIIRKPYVWGGGHGTFYDRGYDCSGTISFFLHHAGLLDQPTPSKAIQSWGDAGPGRWITIYARNGHTFAVIAGMRLDTTGGRAEEGPRWRPNGRSLRDFVARHPKGF